MLKIATYNVNGIRSAIRKGLFDWIAYSKPDVVCFQEVKANLSKIPVLALEAEGYHSNWYPAWKEGYSGVGILSKVKPEVVKSGIGIEKYDREGRVIQIKIHDLSILSVYHPSGSSGEDRQRFKFEWLADFQLYINNLKQAHPNLIIAGDFNICHRAIDIHDPVRNAGSSGFLPEERDWMSHFLNSGFTDSFRYLYPEKSGQYTWWTYRANARENNKGWRIDYIMVAEHLRHRIKEASILPGFKQSDHCPVILELT